MKSTRFVLLLMVGVLVSGLSFSRPSENSVAGNDTTASQDSVVTDSTLVAGIDTLFSCQVPIRLVDIPGMVKKEIAESKMAPAVVSAQRTSNPQNWNLLYGVVLVGAVVLPLLFGFIGLRILMKRRRTIRVPRAAALRGTSQIPDTHRPIGEEVLPVYMTHAQPKKVEVEQEAGPEPSIERGGRKGRSEDLLLTRRFAEGSTEIIRRKSRQALDYHAPHEKHRIRVAKRLGLGVGEVELATTLHEIAARYREKEKES